MRIYLTGRIAFELDGALVVDEGRFRGRQARVAFAYLVCERARPVLHEELAEVVWPGGTPPAWEASLSTIVSRLRGLLSATEAWPEEEAIAGASGSYQLRLPAGAWVDLAAAVAAIDEAEGALRSGDPRRAWGPVNVAATIARRPFLPGEEGEWLQSQREKLQRVLLRALECLAEVWLATDSAGLAVEAATEALAVDSFREGSHRLLMRAHAGAGNRAEALRAYERLRRLLAEELGTDPSAETEALHVELLQ